MSEFNPDWLKGKTIARVEMNPFEAMSDEQLANGAKSRTTYDPTICFTDGSFICFTTEETEVGAYGIKIGYFLVGLSICLCGAPLLRNGKCSVKECVCRS